MGTSRGRALGLALLGCAACVPASDPLPPAGAFGFATHPSVVTAGQPLTTNDGWTIHVQRLALQVSVSASSIAPAQGSSGGSFERFLFDATHDAQVFARAVPVGLASGYMNLSGSYLDGSGSDSDDPTEVIGVDADVQARFLALPDSSRDMGAYSTGPTILLGLRAERAGRVVTCDLTLGLPSGGTDASYQNATVVANALVTVPLTVQVEALFVGLKSRVPQFDDFAATDADGDGVITGAELSGQFLDELYSRSLGLFGGGS